MVTEINRIKQSDFLIKEKKFINNYKKYFANTLANLIDNTGSYDENFRQANSLFEALFNPDIDCYKDQLLYLSAKKDVKTGFIFSSLMYNMLSAYIDFKEYIDKEEILELIHICNNLQNELQNIFACKEDNTFDIAPFLDKTDSIKYLFNMHKLKREIKFIVHGEHKTSIIQTEIKQLGKNSIVIEVSEEQIEIISKSHSSFIIANNPDEENFAVNSKILNTGKKTVLLENILALDSSPLISRKYPRAAMVHASLVHIANEEEYISGNIIDISEGGMGIISSSKGHFIKGQNIVAFIAYEDDQSGFKFSFEANGIITSIIGKEHAFRYGVQLSLRNDEKEVIKNLVKTLTANKKDKETTQTII